MFYAKLVLVVGIAYMLRVTSSPPYFPIEISRCIASNKESTHVFLITIATAFVTSIVVDHAEINRVVIGVFLGLLILGYFNDVDYWLLHMIGVAIMVSSVAITNHKTWQFIIAASFYSLRIGIKLCVIMMYEIPESFWNQCRADPLHITKLPLIMKDITFDIMHHGTCNSVYTRYAFAYGGGMLQWFAFIIMSFCM